MINKKFSQFNDDEEDSLPDNLKMGALIVLILMFIITWIGMMINEYGN
jgi:hypothetical protein